MTATQSRARRWRDGAQKRQGTHTWSRAQEQRSTLGGRRGHNNKLTPQIPDVDPRSAGGPYGSAPFRSW